MKKILFAFLLFISFQSFGQGGWTRPNNSHGVLSKGVGGDSAVYIPTGSGAPSGAIEFYTAPIRKAGIYLDSTNNIFYFYNPKDSTWTAAGAATVVSDSAWSKTGNALTTAGTNFIGTTDAKGLMFKTNNVQSGFIDYDDVNTSFGDNTMVSKTTGTQNSAFGYYALSGNTSGGANVAMGITALTGNTIGNNNVAIGSFSMQNNISGSGNVAVGTSSLSGNTGTSNTAVGSQALYNNTTGVNNIGIGSNSGISNLTLSNRLFINSLNRTTLLDDTTKSIIYGAQDATAADQRLYVNGQFFNPYITSQYNSADSMVVVLPGTGKFGYRLIPTGGSSGITVGTTTITSGTSGRVGYNNAGVYGEYPITGTGNVMMSASPATTGTLTTDNINPATDGASSIGSFSGSKRFSSINLGSAFPGGGAVEMSSIGAGDNSHWVLFNRAGGNDIAFYAVANSAYRLTLTENGEFGIGGNAYLQTNAALQGSVNGYIGLGAVANSKLSVYGSFATAYIAKTANYTATISDYTIHFTSGTSTFTLPTAVGITGRIYVTRNDSGNTLTLATTSSETIDGSAPGTQATGTVKQYQSTGTNWISLN